MWQNSIQAGAYYVLCMEKEKTEKHLMRTEMKKVTAAIFFSLHYICFLESSLTAKADHINPNNPDCFEIEEQSSDLNGWMT